MTKVCEGMGESLFGYLEGWLDDAALRRVESHLGSCQGCARELRVLKRMNGLLERHLPSIEPSPTLASRFAGRLAAEVQAEERGEGGWNWLRLPWLVPLAASVVVLAVVASLPRNEEPARFTGVPASPIERVERVTAPPPQPRRETASEERPRLPEGIEENELGLFVDYAIIRDLEVLEFLEGHRSGAAG